MAGTLLVMSDSRFAADMATSAGRLLLALRDEVADPATRRAEGDRRANELLLAALADTHPDDEVLSEEAKDRSRGDGSRLWIVDPLDGTREFSEGRSDWAVHVALSIDGDLAAGAVALPGLGITLSTAEPGRRAAPVRRGPLRMVVSRTRPPAETLEVAGRLGAELIAMGSAGAKAMAVVRGEADVYLHAGGQYEWDSAAPVAVARAAGMHTSRIDGSALVYGNEDPWLPDLLICRPDVADDVLAAASAAGLAS